MSILVHVKFNLRLVMIKGFAEFQGDDSINNYKLKDPTCNFKGQ